MKYHTLKHQLQPLVVFSLRDILLLDPHFRQATLYDWKKSGAVIQLRNNCYVFNDFTPTDKDYYLLSNLIYTPSYISTELALNHYGIIPEAVAVFTAITTNKTQSFGTPLGTFSYQKLRPELFFGYTLIEVRQHGTQIASLEKAVLDYLYLHSSVSSEQDFEGLRWNKLLLQEEMRREKVEEYLAMFASLALSARVKHLYDYLR